MKDLIHICTAFPDYPRCNFNREWVYYHLYDHKITFEYTGAIYNIHRKYEYFEGLRDNMVYI